VWWYEAIFFDVRDRLSVRTFILHEVIERYRVQAEHDWPAYGWKLLAYSAGSATLQEVLGMNQVSDVPVLQAHLQQQARLMLIEKLRAGVQQVGTDKPHDLARLMQALEGRSCRSSTEEPALTDFEINVAAMMQEIRWTVGPRKAGDTSPLAQFDGSAIEPRADEMLRAAMGLPSSLTEEEKNFRLPPPRPKQHSLSMLAKEEPCA
jgi:hypothetical protein